MQPEISPQSAQAFSAAFFTHRKLVFAALLFLAMWFMPLRGIAHPFTFEECKEASDFVKNTAIARDNGIPESILIDRISDNIEILRSLPSQLHRYIQDDDDAKLLINAAINVFQHPKSAHAHQVDFFHDCVKSEKPITDTSKADM